MTSLSGVELVIWSAVVQSIGQLDYEGLAYNYEHLADLVVQKCRDMNLTEEISK